MIILKLIIIGNNKELVYCVNISNNKELSYYVNIEISNW